MADVVADPFVLGRFGTGQVQRVGPGLVEDRPEHGVDLEEVGVRVRRLDQERRLAFGGGGQRSVEGDLGGRTGQFDRARRDGGRLNLGPQQQGRHGGTDGDRTQRVGAGLVHPAPQPPGPRRVFRLGGLPDVHRLEVAVVRVGEADPLDDRQVLVGPELVEAAAWTGAARSRPPRSSTVLGSTARTPRAER